MASPLAVCARAHTLRDATHPPTPPARPVRQADRLEDSTAARRAAGGPRARPRVTKENAQNPCTTSVSHLSDVVTFTL